MPLTSATKLKLSKIKNNTFNPAAGQDTKIIIDSILENDSSLDDVSTLTDNSGGTASDTIGIIGATYSQPEVRNAIASLSAKINAILNALDG
jgi:hypothetical protein